MAHVIRSCPFCSSSSHYVAPNVSIEIATPLPTPDRFKGTAVICAGCGHVEYFVDDVRAVVQHLGAHPENVTTSPFR